MPRALVTGANGFIGHHLVRELLRRGYEVNCLVRVTSDLTLLRGLPVSIHIGDIRQPETLVAPMQDVEYVFHVAANLLVITAEAFYTTNVQGTINMLEAAEKYAKGTLKRFLYVSSEAAAGPNPTDTPFDETMALKPISWYGTSKKRAEEAVHTFADRLPVTIVRPSAVYGEEEKDITQTFPVIRAGIILPRPGLDNKKLVMVYVADLVRGFVDAAESGATLNQAYFLNHKEILTSTDVVKIGAAILGKPNVPVVPFPMFFLRLAAPLADLSYYLTRHRPATTTDKVRELSQHYWIADPSKAKRDFGWEAAFSLREGMAKTIAYWLDKEGEPRREVAAEPLRERAAMTFGLALVAGMVEALVDLTLGGVDLTAFANALGMSVAYWWFTLAAMLGAFGGLMGGVALLTRGRSPVWQFVAGAALGSGMELLNQLVLHWWAWNPATFGRIPGPWLPALLLGLPAGVYPIVLNLAVDAFYRRKLRYR